MAGALSLLDSPSLLNSLGPVAVGEGTRAGVVSCRLWTRAGDNRYAGFRFPRTSRKEVGRRMAGRARAGSFHRALSGRIQN